MRVILITHTLLLFVTKTDVTGEGYYFSLYTGMKQILGDYKAGPCLDDQLLFLKQLKIIGWDRADQ